MVQLHRLFSFVLTKDEWLWSYGCRTHLSSQPALLPRLFFQRPLKIAKAEANDTATKCRNHVEPPNRTKRETISSEIRSIFYRSDVPVLLPKPESLQPAQVWLWPDLAKFEDPIAVPQPWPTTTRTVSTWTLTSYTPLCVCVCLYIYIYIYKYMWMNNVNH